MSVTVAHSIWARCSERARLLIEWDTDPQFRSRKRVEGPVGDGATVALDGLPANQRISVRAKFSREAERGESEWATATFATPRDRSRAHRLDGRHVRPRLRSQSRMGRAARLRSDARNGARCLHPLRRSDLRGQSDPAAANGSPTAASGTTSRTTTSRASPKLSTIFAPGSPTTSTTSTCVRSPPKSRSSRNGTITRRTTIGGRARRSTDDRYQRERDASKLAAFARQAMHEWVPVPDADLSRRALRPAARCVRARLPIVSLAEHAGRHGDARCGSKRSGSSMRCAHRRATWKLVACDQPLALVIAMHDVGFEGFGNYARPADRVARVELAQISRRTTRACRTSLDHRRRALRRRASLHPRATHGGNSSPARSTPARSARTRSIRRSAPS